MFSRISTMIAAGLLAVGMGGAASAATVGGTVTGNFTGEDAGSPSCGWLGCFGTDGAVVSADGKTVSWPGATCVFGCADPSNKSTLTINDGAFSSSVPSTGGTVDLFSLTWYNASTPSLTTPDDFNAFANFILAYTVPGIGGGSESVTFHIENTGNPSGDLISAALAFGPLDFGGLPLHLAGGVLVTGYSMAISGAGSFCANGVWCNPERGTSTLTVSAILAPVPVPAAGFLLVGALGGLAAMRRRKKA